MSQLFLTFLITFIVIAAIAFLISHCRRRLQKTAHGLSGMCHKDGGPVCHTCQHQMRITGSAESIEKTPSKT